MAKTSLKLFKVKCKKCKGACEELWRGETNAKNKFVPIELLAIHCKQCAIEDKVEYGQTRNPNN